MTYDKISLRIAAPLILFVVSLILFLPSFQFGHIPGDSSKFNVVWLSEFADQLFKGHLYPRWLPGMNAGFGGPDFYFYGPLPFYIGAPFTLIASEKMAVVLLSWTLCLMSGLTMYAFATTQVTRDRALFSGVIYMAAPYHLILAIMTRNVIGEQAAIALMPLALYFAAKLPDSPRAALGLALAFAGIAYSHLATTLLFLPLLVGFCLLRVAQMQRFDVLVRAAIAGMLGAALTAAYVLPALSFADMIKPYYWDDWKPAKNFLFAAEGDIARLVPNYYFILHGFIGASLLCLISVLIYLAVIGPRKSLIVWGPATLFYLFINLEISAPLWNAVELFDRVQFPWRSLTVMELCLAIMAAYAVGVFARRATILLTIMLGVGSIGLISLNVITYDRIQIMRYGEQLEDTVIRQRWSPREYFPACLNPENDKVISDRILRRDLSTAGEMPKFYYPFLVGAEGQMLSCDPETGFVRDAAGIAPVRVQRPPIEQLGNAITLTTLALIFGGLWYFSPARVARREGERAKLYP